MKRNLHYFLAIVMVTVFAACSKDSKEEEIPECESQNFGVAKLNFATTSVAHTINAGHGDKVVPAGQASDTFRLVTGAHMIKIHSTVLSDTLAFAATIMQCEQTAISVP